MKSKKSKYVVERKVPCAWRHTNGMGISRYRPKPTSTRFDDVIPLSFGNRVMQSFSRFLWFQELNWDEHSVQIQSNQTEQNQIIKNELYSLKIESKWMKNQIKLLYLGYVRFKPISFIFNWFFRLDLIFRLFYLILTSVWT